MHNLVSGADALQSHLCGLRIQDGFGNLRSINKSVIFHLMLADLNFPCDLSRPGHLVPSGPLYLSNSLVYSISGLLISKALAKMRSV